MCPIDGVLLSVRAGYLDGSGSMANRSLRSARLVRIQATFNKALRFFKTCARKPTWAVSQGGEIDE